MYEDSDLQRIYDEKYFEGRGSEEKWKRRAKFIAEKFQPKKTLDIGCSWGQLVFHLNNNGIDAYGIDGSDAALSKADKTIKHKLHKVNLNDDPFPFEDKVFDFVTGFYSIEHIHNFEFSRHQEKIISRRFFFNKFM